MPVSTKTALLRTGWWLAGALTSAASLGANVDVVEIVDVPRPNLADPAVMERVLREWKDANIRTPPSTLLPCPISCTASGTDPGGWHVFSDVASLGQCNETLILDFAVYAKISDKNTPSAIRACTADYESNAANRKRAEPATLCSSANQVQVKIPVQMTWKGDGQNPAAREILASSRQIQNYLGKLKSSCVNNTLSFGYSRSTVVGLYAGSQMHRQALSDEVLEGFITHVSEKGIADALVVQICGQDDRGADYVLGIAASTRLSGLAFVQDAVKTWSSGGCVAELDGSTEWTRASLQVPAPVYGSNQSMNATAVTLASRSQPVRLHGRADCRTTTVNPSDGCWAVAQRCGTSESALKQYNTRANFCNTLIAGETVCCTAGSLPDKSPPPKSDGTCQTIKVEYRDGCASLATKCGIPGPDITKYNTKENFCATLRAGQSICCGRGKLPDLTPKPNSDGSCYVYTTKDNDNCDLIANEYGLTIDKLEEYNKQTWGWNGCEILWVGVSMCLSTGTAPMPAPVKNAVCGPTVPGTKKPQNGTLIANLNPCPLKTCCNIWGQCGTTADFCVPTKSRTGAPGTAAPNTHGCISNCGMHIVKSQPPPKKMKVAYFSAWNHERDCLVMNVDQIPPLSYTHIHFAFAEVTPDFKVDVSKVQDQFDRFKAMKSVKKIISFGGWDFSTSPGTYRILREATKYKNRWTFKTNVVAFVNEHGLDGVDIDWEYPGAPDIPDIPAGDFDEGQDYFSTLYDIKNLLPAEKTVSFAAPASYWYLKAFPIEVMGFWLDYIIYMTYDLHGQWDYGNPWTQPGCDGGNCLRSHVNLTETINALSMITKAGVASNKVVVGVTSYGRSFRMSTAGCTGPMCTFTGSPRVSNAAKGVCTNTAGYISNAEIDEIIGNGGNVQTWYDTESSSDILVYDNYEWVSYMTSITKLVRDALYTSWNFAGTTDWAVDLQQYLLLNYLGEDPVPTYEPCDNTYSNLDDIERDRYNIKPYCADQYVLDVLSKLLKSSIDKYWAIMARGYDGKFNSFSKAVRKTWEDDLYNFYQDHTDEYYECVQQTNYGPGNWRNDSIACPPKYVSGRAFNIYMIPKDEKKLYEFLEKEYGILREWIYPSVLELLPCIQETPDYPCDKWGKLHGPPELKGDFQPPNPKESIEKSLATLGDVAVYLDDTVFSIVLDLFPGSTIDAVDTGSLPALMAQAAVESMDQIYEAGEEIQKEERKQIILLALTAILFVIPGLGEAAAAVTGIAMLARIATIVAEIGGAAIGTYEIASDPKNAVLGVFEILIGMLPIRGGLKEGFTKAAKIRRGMSSKQLDELGPVVKGGLNKISTVCKVCKG